MQFAVNAGDALTFIDAGLLPLGGGEDEDLASIQAVKLVGIASPVVDGELEGLTPGFWRTHSEFGPAPLKGWPETGYSPLDSYNDVFGVNVAGDPTLLGAVWRNGGGVNALMRHSAAALLNTAHPNVNYEFSVDEVIAKTQAAIDSGNAAQIESTKDEFDFANNRGTQGAFESGDFETTKDTFDNENNQGNVDLKSGFGSNATGTGTADEGSSSTGDNDDFFTSLGDEEDDDDDVIVGNGNGNGKGQRERERKGKGQVAVELGFSKAMRIW